MDTQKILKKRDKKDKKDKKKDKKHHKEDPEIVEDEVKVETEQVQSDSEEEDVRDNVALPSIVAEPSAKQGTVEADSKQQSHNYRILLGCQIC